VINGVAVGIPTKPIYVWNGQTLTGGADLPDGAERSVSLKGRPCEVEKGTWITVTGRLRVTLRSVAGWEPVPSQNSESPNGRSGELWSVREAPPILTDHDSRVSQVDQPNSEF
jgi:hypothetical protein